MEAFRQFEPERFAMWVAGPERVREAEQSGRIKRGRVD